jgi:hypothetical protein
VRIDYRTFLNFTGLATMTTISLNNGKQFLFMNLRTSTQVGITVLVGLSVAAAVAYLNRWQLATFSVVPLLTTLFSLGLALIALVLWRRKSSRVHSLGGNLLLLSLVLTLQLAFFPFGQTFRDWEVKRAQAFIESLIPKLEDYKRQHSDYPANINPFLSSDAAIPPLLQLSSQLPVSYDNRHFYEREGATYRFQFHVPDGFVGFQYTYCCGADGAWTVTD